MPPKTTPPNPSSADRFTPRRTFKNKAAWHGWLEKNHAGSDGLWVQFAKKHSGIASVTYAEALESALCFGWIDGQKQKFDADYFLQRFTRRRPNSLWSKINREAALSLIERGLMQAAGLAAIEQAKANGRWEGAYDSPSNSVVPPDLETALKSSPKAAAAFGQFNRQNRFAIIFRLRTARKPATRAALLIKFVEMLESNEKLYP